MIRIENSPGCPFQWSSIQQGALAIWVQITDHSWSGAKWPPLLSGSIRGMVANSTHLQGPPISLSTGYCWGAWHGCTLYFVEMTRPGPVGVSL